jgi:hypothetical protein
LTNNHIKSLLSLQIGKGELQLATALHRKKEVVIFIIQINDCVVVFAQNPEIVLLHKKVNDVINH